LPVLDPALSQGTNDDAASWGTLPDSVSKEKACSHREETLQALLVQAGRLKVSSGEGRTAFVTRPQKKI
jgi:hypothetical protein